MKLPTNPPKQNRPAGTPPAQTRPAALPCPAWPLGAACDPVQPAGTRVLRENMQPACGTEATQLKHTHLFYSLQHIQKMFY